MAAHAPTRPPRARWRSRLATGLVTVAVALTAGAGSGGASSGDFVARINGARSSRGLASLATHSELNARAQEWAQYMASRGAISHSNVSARVKAPWERLGENVGRGGSVDQIHSMFMNSASHRGNILDGGFQYVGVGTAVRDGQIYVAQIFMRMRGTAAAAAPAPRRTAAPAASRSGRRPAPVPAPAPPPPPPPPPTPSATMQDSLSRLRGTSPT